jgi:O-antigen/teichoic acid export membrane protein
MKFLKQVSLYTLVGVISAGINFLMMPLLSRHLSPADYGLLSLFNTYVIILLPIVSISAYSLLSVEYFKQKNKKVFSSQFSSIQIIPFINALLLALVTWGFYGRFADNLELQDTGIKWGFIILLITLLNIYCDQFIQYLILQKKARKFALYSLLKVGVEVTLTFYFIVIKGWNWEGRMYSWLIASALFFICGFIYFYKEGLLQGRVQWKFMREGIAFGAPLVLHGIGKFVVNQSDRLFIVKMVSLEEAGVYNVGYTIGTLVMIVVNAFFNFYTPFLMERLGNVDKEKRLQIVKMGYFYFGGCLLLLLLIILLTPMFFRYFIDLRYVEAVKYVFWVALGYCFWGGYMLFSGFIFFFKRNYILGWLSIFNVITNLILNYILINAYGAIGAAYATALSFLLIMLMVMYITHRFMPLPWFSYRSIKTVKLT